MTEDTLHQAIALAQAGQKDQARALLQQVLSDNPANETAWLWLTDCVTTSQERILALETCLRFVPNSRAARAGLAALRGQAGSPAEATAASEAQAAILPEAEAPVTAGLDLPGEETWPPEAGSPPGEAAPAWPAEAQPFQTAESLPATESAPPDQAPPADTEADVFPAAEEVDAGGNEWPQLRDQIELEPWMQEMADEAGPALGALLGKPEESGGLPERAKAYDNLPTLPVRHPEPPPAFTVPPEDITEEEFSEVENRTQAELRNRPVIRPLDIQPEQADLAPSGLPGPEDEVTGVEQPAPDELQAADVQRAAEALRQEEPNRQTQPPTAGLDMETGDAAPPTIRPAAQPAGRPRRKSAARRKSSRSQAILIILLVIVGLLGIAAVLFGLILSMG
jgi:hypothetical protein